MRIRSCLLAAVLLLLSPPVRAGDLTPHRGGFILAGEAVSFDADLRPLFTARQVSSTAKPTRVGFDRWARTEEGKSIIRRIRDDRTVIIEEDSEQSALGRAPQPGFTVLLAAQDPKIRKRYTIILNPMIAAQYENELAVDLGRPRSATDAMALAWAAEMLHIDFYAQGIALPHHERADFQERWLSIASELGFRITPHGGEER